jgi:hypothetical protein
MDIWMIMINYGCFLLNTTQTCTSYTYCIYDHAVHSMCLNFMFALCIVM